MSQRQTLRDYKMTFAPEYGQRVLDDLRAKCFVDFTTMMPSPVDPLMLAYREGCRAVWLGIQEAIAAASRPEPVATAMTVDDPNEKENPDA